jgi:hypothetical protein
VPTFERLIVDRHTIVEGVAEHHRVAARRANFIVLRVE